LTNYLGKNDIFAVAMEIVYFMD